jgi:hypothetical protein
LRAGTWAKQEGRQFALVHGFGAGGLLIVLALTAAFLALAFLAVLGLLIPLRFLRRRLGDGSSRGGSLSPSFRRFHAGDMVMEFSAGRTAVMMLAVASAATIPPTAALGAAVITTMAGFLAHLDVHHLAAYQLLSG